MRLGNSQDRAPAIPGTLLLPPDLSAQPSGFSHSVPTVPILLPPVPRDRPQPRAESSPGHEALPEVGAAKKRGKSSGESLPGLTCPSSYCFVSQPFLKFSRSGCKEGERRSELRAGPPAAASSQGARNGSSLIKHSLHPERPAPGKLDHCAVWRLNVCSEEAQGSAAWFSRAGPFLALVISYC